GERPWGGHAVARCFGPVRHHRAPAGPRRVPHPPATVEDTRAHARSAPPARCHASLGGCGSLGPPGRRSRCPRLTAGPGSPALVAGLAALARTSVLRPNLPPHTAHPAARPRPQSAARRAPELFPPPTGLNYFQPTL